MSDSNLYKKEDVAEEEQKCLKDVVQDELDKKSRGSRWLWLLFILCLSPNIINGFHVNSYVFLSKIPPTYYCIIPQLENNNWSHDQIRNISVRGGLNVNQSCQVLNYNYDKFAELTYDKALDYINNTKEPEEVPCLSIEDSYFHYEQGEGESFVPEWNLICERTALRSTVQVALSIGKFIGASGFGIISDRFGRKASFSLAAILYIISGLTTTYAQSYIMLIIGRIGLGLCGAGVFYSLFTLITENSGPSHRSWLSIAYNFSYPIGMLYLAASAYLIPKWRDLQMALTIPSFLLIIHLIFLVESPRWLLSKGKTKKAYKMVFGGKPSVQLMLEVQKAKEEKLALKTKQKEEESEESKTFGEKFKGFFQELVHLYGPSTLRKRALIAHFTWCVTSLSYYVLALNAENFKANVYLYVAMTGSVDILGYIISMVILRYMGRRFSSAMLFTLAGVSLLVVLAIPKTSLLVVFFAMLSRFSITSVYAIMTLHTAELFPTEIRNTALGISSTAAHVGSIFAPYIVDILGLVAWFIPTTICGVSVLAAGLLTLLQPETKGRNLTDHVNQETANQDIELSNHKEKE